MPPRRSSRSTRASVEPQPAESAKPPFIAATVTTKRKRGQSTELTTEPAAAKPPSRSRRSLSAKPESSVLVTQGRGATARSTRASLKDVIEEDEDEEEEEEEEEKPRAKKRARPSVDEEEVETSHPRRSSRKASSSKAITATLPDDDGDDEEEEMQEKPRARRTRQSVEPKTKKAVAQTVDSDEEEEPEEPKPRRGASRSRKNEEAPPPTATRKPPSRRSSVKPPSTTRKASGTAAARGKAKMVDQIMEIDEEDSEDAAPPKRSSAKGKGKGKQRAVSDEDEDQAIKQESSQATSRAPSPASQRTTVNDDSDQVPTPRADVDTEEEEEPKSLLDPPPKRLPVQPARSLMLEQPAEDASPKSRLVIHKMALIDFKSYAGRQEIGPFHKSFSSIVGPNGSGKSNTIDALLFVFGYRATKMRQGKLSELIHNSARYPDLQECSVEVHFQEIMDLPGSDAFEVVEGSKLIVTRIAYKNNSSKYTINGRPSTYTDVQKLLKGKGIDLDHNRFLILQGEVESIAQMKPKATEQESEGLLEYLEDIIGTSRFKEPIEGALTEMERLNEDRGEKLNRLRHVEKEKNKLEEHKKEAEDFLRLKNEHTRAKDRLIQYNLWVYFDLQRKCGISINKLEKELAEETERFKDDVKHLEMLEKHYQEREQTYKDVQAAAEAVAKELMTLEKKEVNLEERKKHTSGKHKKLKKSIQEDQHAEAEANRAIKDSADKMKREKTKLEQYEASLEQEEKVLESIRDSLKDKTQVFHDQIEVKQRELIPWTTKVNAKNAELSNAQSERDALAKRAEALREACARAQEELRALKEELSAKIDEQNELQRAKVGLSDEKKGAEQTLRGLQARVQELRGKASSSRQKVDEARASQQASTSQNKVLDALTRLKSQSRVEGFHGRLGSLGTIPEKYDVAITTACSALNNMIVDTVEQGQTCIEYLRTHNIGRASFMVLDKLGNQDMSGKRTPENAPRLFDLITPREPRFAPAFYKAIRDTLVADNLEQANKIAFGGNTRWRVVTLAGQLIDSSGTMSGGGHHVSRGGMSAKLQADSVSPQVLRQYEKESEDMSQMLEEAMQQQRAAEAEVESITTSGPQIEMNLAKLGMAVSNIRARIADAEKRVRQLESQNKPDAKDVARIKELDSVIRKTESELDKLQERTSEIEQAIKDLEQKIIDVGGSKYLMQKSTVDGLKDYINIASDEITKAEVAKAKAEKDSAKYAAAVENNKGTLGGIQEELDKLSRELEVLQALVGEVRDKVEEAQAAAESRKEDLEQLKLQLDEKMEEVSEFRQKETHIKHDLDIKHKEHKELERQINHLEEEHNELKLIDIDDDDDEEETEGGSSKGEQGESAAATPEGDQDEDEDVKPNISGGKQARDANVLPEYTTEQLKSMKRNELMAHVELLDEKVKRANPNLEVLKEYKKREEEYLRRAEDLENITNERDKQKQTYDDLRKQRLEEFMAGFNLISLKLKEMYQMITLGGNAELELVDSMDPFSEGIIFSVMPPKKSWKNISNLSGGEKTLSSLALVFALHVFKPTPLYFMDEIDAALDFRNVSIVANYIKDRTKNAQFIIISLRNDMFELSHRLIGIYKTNNATHSIAIDNHALHFVKPADSANAA